MHQSLIKTNLKSRFLVKLFIFHVFFKKVKKEPDFHHSSCMNWFCMCTCGTFPFCRFYPLIHIFSGKFIFFLFLFEINNFYSAWTNIISYCYNMIRWIVSVGIRSIFSYYNKGEDIFLRTLNFYNFCIL